MQQQFEEMRLRQVVASCGAKHSLKHGPCPWAKTTGQSNSKTIASFPAVAVAVTAV
jgi:hypothetical protein